MHDKRATHYNSSISQAFMVMSFVAAALLMSVQLSGGDRASTSSRQAHPSSHSPTADLQDPVAFPDSQDGPSDRAAMVEKKMEASVRDSIGGQSSPQPAISPQAAFFAQWNWFVQPILYPMNVVKTHLVQRPTAQPGVTHNRDAAIDIKEGDQVTSLPSPSVVISPSNSQFSVDSSSPDSSHQTVSKAQINQTEHILTEQAGAGRTDPSLVTGSSASELERAEQTFQSQSPRLFPHSNPSPQDSTNDAIASDQTGQTNQNNIQQGQPTARLVVDLSDRQLAFYPHNEPIQTYPIAVGKVGWETPLGEFTVTDKDPNPLWQHPLTGELVPAGADSPLGSRWIGFWSDGIHQIGFHGTNKSQSIGQAISHGCIRLHDDDIQELYSQIPVGTPVIVQP